MHERACPANSGGHCECFAAEENLIARASRPSPAELIRRMKASGSLKGVHVYSNTKTP
jgi:hypothetical protein